MTVDHYAGAARGWAEGAAIVYGPIARELLATSPHLLSARTVLDAGSGTGLVSSALAGLGATSIALNLSFDMLAWEMGHRPPAVVGDVTRLPLHDDAVDDTVAAFVYNHLDRPEPAFADAIRVTRSGGALLACVYANANRSEVRDAIDDAAREKGWRVPEWYVRLKQMATPLLGTAEHMTRVAHAAGLAHVDVDERPVDVGITEPEDLVTYRLGQAHFSSWLEELGPARAEEVRAELVAAIRPIMRPYRPVVVFLSATVP